MSPRTPRRRPSDDIPTASMADIAFLLLIFFLVTTVFPDDRGLPLALPRDGSPEPVPAENLLQLQVGQDGWVEVRAGNSPMAARHHPDDLAAIWRTAAATNPRLIAAVRTHPDAPYGHMVNVLDALHQAGARRVSLQVLEVR